jgi:hypothetical protein
MAGVASLFFYIVVLVVSVTSVLFGLDWLSTPPPRAKPPAQVVASTVKPAPQPAKDSVSNKVVVPVKQAAKAAPSALPPAAETAAVPSAADNSPATASASAAQPTTVGDAQPDTTAAIAPPAASPRCDVQACATAYRSFRASDCTWQPFDGPRRQCTKGRPQARANQAHASHVAADMTTAANQAQARACNIAACERAYSSFDPADCTYKPYDGPRRFCAK